MGGDPQPVAVRCRLCPGRARLPRSPGWGPRPVAELAARCGADPAGLERLLRCAAGLGLLARPARRRHLLVSVPGSLHAAILAAGEAAAWQAMTGLADTARTGEPASTAQRGQNYCDYLAARQASARHVSDVTASRSADIAPVVARLDFNGSTVIAEIGGCGIIVAAVLAAHPSCAASCSIAPACSGWLATTWPPPA